MKLLATALLAFSLPLLASSPVKLKSSEVSFEAVGSLGFPTIEGEGGKLVAENLVSDGQKVWGGLKVDLTKLKTGMELRDEHMNDYLGTAKKKFAMLKLDPVSFKARKFTGTLSIKSDVKKVAGTIQFSAGKVKAKFKIDLGDFPSVGTPKWKDITVSDEVTIEVSAIMLL
jgi:hypothetical protein